MKRPYAAVRTEGGKDVCLYEDSGHVHISIDGQLVFVLFKRGLACIYADAFKALKIPYILIEHE